MNTVVMLLGLICILFITNAETSEIECPKQINGKTNGDVTITCRYSINTSANKHARKYFCVQGQRSGYCENTIITNEDTFRTKFLGRINMDDNKKEGIINITISQLEKSDEAGYICGIGMDNGRKKSLISLAVTDERAITVESKLIYSNLWSAVTLPCKSDEQSVTQLCKISKTGCTTIINSLGIVDSLYVGRVAIKADEKNPGTSHITLAQLQRKDVAYYSCGVGKTTYDLRINEDTNIPQSLGSYSTRLGGSLSAHCNYNIKQNFTMKSYCRWKSGNCRTIINTDGEVKDTYKGRIFIYDDTSSGLMQVVMSNFSKEDEGWYWFVLTDETHEQICAIHVDFSKVNYEGLSGNKIIQVHERDAVEISCTNPCRFQTYELLWCKMKSYRCDTLISKEKTENNSSFSCQPQKFILNFNSVSLEDNGVYWCAVKKDGKYVDAISVEMIVEEPRVNSRSNGESRNNEVVTAAPSYNNNTAVIAASVSVCVVVLIALSVFFLRVRRRNNSDLVSVGSYRTNISMTDLYNSIGKDNPGVTHLQETCVSNPEDVPKEKKKESQEELDYSSFLIHENVKEQDIM